MKLFARIRNLLKKIGQDLFVKTKKRLVGKVSKSQNINT